jgi:NOL1/NOP2/fmu family ribosome biogenesis protein
MRQPVAVKLGTFIKDDYRLQIDASLAKGAEI